MKFSPSKEIQTLAKNRQVTSRLYSIALVVMFVGFLLLACYNKPFISKMVIPGLSLGILMGVGVIIGAWLLTFFYVKWANKKYDVATNKMLQKERH